MGKKDGKPYVFSEYPEASPTLRLLDGKERRIRLTLATVRKFESFQLASGEGTAAHLEYDRIAELLWAVLLDKEDLAGPEQLLELTTAAMLPGLLLSITEAATAEGVALKNGWAQVREKTAAAASPGPASTLTHASSSGSAPANSGPIPPVNSDTSTMRT